MYPFAALVSMLAVSSGFSNDTMSNRIVSPKMIRFEKSREYPSMLSCVLGGGECPEGSMCVKLIGKYGICVVKNE